MMGADDGGQTRVAEAEKQEGSVGIVQAGCQALLTDWMLGVGRAESKAGVSGLSK